MHHEPGSLSLDATIPRLAPFQVIIPPHPSLYFGYHVSTNLNLASERYVP